MFWIVFGDSSSRRMSMLMTPTPGWRCPRPSCCILLQNGQPEPPTSQSITHQWEFIIYCSCLLQCILVVRVNITARSLLLYLVQSKNICLSTACVMHGPSSQQWNTQSLCSFPCFFKKSQASTGTHSEQLIIIFCMHNKKWSTWCISPDFQCCWQVLLIHLLLFIEEDKCPHKNDSQNGVVCSLHCA